MRRALLVQLARLGDLAQSLPLRDALLASGAADEVDLVAALEPAGWLRGRFARVAVLPPEALSPGGGPARRLRWLREALEPLEPGPGWERAVCLNDERPATALADGLPARIRQGAGAPGDPGSRWLRALVRDRRGNRLLLAEALLAALPGVETPAPRRREPGAGAVLVHPGSGHEARRLPKDFWTSLLAGLAGGGRRVALTGSSAERALCEEILLALPDPGAVELLAGRTDLAGLQDELEHAALLVAQDTGVLHLAAALRTPLLGLYHGSASLSETGPFLDGALALQIEAGCHPCAEGRPDCGDFACRASLDAVDALAAARFALGEAGPPEPPAGACRLFEMRADPGGARAVALHGPPPDEGRRRRQLSLLRGLGGAAAADERRRERLDDWLAGGRPRRDWLRREWRAEPATVEEHWHWLLERDAFGRTG